MAPDEPVAREAGPLRRLPSGKFLFGLIEGATDEVIALAHRPGMRLVCPITDQLWTHCESNADRALERDPADIVSLAFKARWSELDKVCGTPESRFWKMDYSEARLRLKAMIRFLYRIGPLDLGSAEADAPREFLADEEVEGA
jgi:hypothetical protein